MRKKRDVGQGFDREAFLLGIGLGIVFVGVGALIIWATLTAPEGGTQSTGFTTAQRLARVLPRNIQNWLALGLGGLFVLFGVVTFGLGVGTVVKYVWGKVRG
jgi:hypothetical protein